MLTNFRIHNNDRVVKCVDKCVCLYITWFHRCKIIDWNTLCATPLDSLGYESFRVVKYFLIVAGKKLRAPNRLLTES